MQALCITRAIGAWVSDAEIRFMEPLWRRVALTAACVIWSAVEWYNGDAFWGVVTAAAAAYAAWNYLIRFDPKKAG
jgi:hypothetical protein